MQSDSDAKWLVLRSVKSKTLERVVQTAVPALALMAALNGCTTQDPDAPGHPSQAVATPTSSDQCNHRAKMYGDGNGIGLKAHWLETRHHWGASAPVFVCSGGSLSATVTAKGPPGVTVTPTSQQFDPDNASIVQFDITVEEGAVGHVLIGATMNNSIGNGGVASPDIVAAGDGWAFAEESRD